MLDRSCPAESAQPPRAGTGVTQSHTTLRRTGGICGKHPSKPLPCLPRAWRPCGRNAGAATFYLQSCPYPTRALRPDPKSLLSCPCPSLSLLSSVRFTCVRGRPAPVPSPALPAGSSSLPLYPGTCLSRRRPPALSSSGPLLPEGLGFSPKFLCRFTAASSLAWRWEVATLRLGA